MAFIMDMVVVMTHGQIGNDEIVVIVVPLGYHILMKRFNIDAQTVCREALIDRVRAALIADNMLVAS